MSRSFSPLLFLFFTFAFVSGFSQTINKPKNNEFRIGGGISSTKRFTGIDIGGAYNRHFGKNFLSAQYNYLEEFVLLGNSHGSAGEYAILVNRELVSAFVKLSVGAGLSLVKHRINNNPDYFILHQFGVPIELNITLGKGWFKTGLSVHYNANSYDPYCNFNWVYQFRLF